MPYVRNKGYKFKKCQRCDEFKDEEEFDKLNDPYCAPCMQESYSGKFWREEQDDFRDYIDRSVLNMEVRDVRRALREEQEDRCAICGNDHVPLSLDHDHSTGYVRGMLCAHCNTGLGMFNDNIESLMRAKAYLQKNYSHRAKILYSHSRTRAKIRSW